MPIKRNYNRSVLSFEQSVSKFNRTDKTAQRIPRNHPEDDLQMVCVKWFDAQYPQYGLLLHHSPNGGKRNAREAARFKRMGVRAGFPDLQLLVANQGYNGLFTELKAGKGTQSDSQKVFQAILEAQGYKYVVIRTLDQFQQEIENYLK